MKPPKAKPNPNFEKIAKLTPRQREILDAVWTGFQDKQISALLKISTRTVNVHVSDLLKRLNVKSRIEAALIYERAHGRG